MKVRIILEPEIRETLTLEEAIIAVENSLVAFNSGRAILPGVINLNLPASEGEVHVKGAYIEGESYYVIKIASGFYLNPSFGLPVSDGLMLAFSAKNGQLEAVLFDHGYLTEMRTAAAGAVVAKYLARKTIKRVGIIGSGTQARFQLRSLKAVRDFEEVAVWSRTPSHVLKYMEEMKIILPEVSFRMALSPEEAVRSADVVITATPSRAPLVKGEWLSPGMHITAMGSDDPDKQELYPDVFLKADLVYADSLKQARSLGEIHHALEAGVIDETRITGEVGEIILGLKPPRTKEEEITLADLTGLGVQDAAVATLVLTKAAAAGLGQSIDV